MLELRALLTENGRHPSRRTFERRLKAIPETLPAQTGCLGRCLVALIVPWRDCARAAAIDGAVLHACGGVWHKKHREAGTVPHTPIDTEAHWTKSGWHGWVYGWKLHLVASAAAVWIPLAAALTAANRADNEEAPTLILELPTELCFLLGNVHYLGPVLEELCKEHDIVLVKSHNTNGRPYPHTEPGVEMRRVLHKTRSLAVESFNTPKHIHADRPCRLIIKVGQYECLNPGCERKYFTRSIKEVQPHARHSREAKNKAKKLYRKGNAALREVQAQMREDFHTAPPALINYTVVHEMAHLRVLKHSPAFWAELHRMMPDHKMRWSLLKELGPRLTV